MKSNRRFGTAKRLNQIITCREYIFNSIEYNMSFGSAKPTKVEDKL